MVSDSSEDPTAADRPADDEAIAGDGTGSRLVDSWIALDRGWQALALGLAIVAAHAAVQFAAAPF